MSYWRLLYLPRCCLYENVFYTSYVSLYCFKHTVCPWTPRTNMTYISNFACVIVAKTCRLNFFAKVSSVCTNYRRMRQEEWVWSGRFNNVERRSLTIRLHGCFVKTAFQIWFDISVGLTLALKGGKVYN